MTSGKTKAQLSHSADKGPRMVKRGTSRGWREVGGRRQGGKGPKTAAGVTQTGKGPRAATTNTTCFTKPIEADKNIFQLDRGAIRRKNPA